MSTQNSQPQRRVVVTGLGFITSIGNNREQVLTSLRELRTGIEYYPDLERSGVLVRLVGTVKEFSFPELHSDEWTYPAAYTIPREHLRSMGPNAVYGFCAMKQAIAEAQLSPELVSHPRTGAMCASGGSSWLSYDYMDMMLEKGPQRCNPMAMIASIAGTLNMNFVSCFGIKGHSLGFSSACASSAHALGEAFDRIRLNRQDIVFVAGAEDCDLFTILPFVGTRALTTGTDPSISPCAFDVKRDGFAVTGGGAVLVLEELEHARRRGAPIQAEMIGWGEASDGYSVMAPEPEGDGLRRAMDAAIGEAGISPAEVDYINAHGTGTQANDSTETRAIRQVFGSHANELAVSSTKSMHGHALGAAGALEAVATLLAFRSDFLPPTANFLERDPVCDLDVVPNEARAAQIEGALSNSFAFGGLNAVLAFRRVTE